MDQAFELSPLEARRAVAIARAERRWEALERLSEIGMHLAEQVGAHAAAAMAAVNEDNGGDPGRAFATIARAVRMTLALESRVDEQILAMHAGDFRPLSPRRRAEPCARRDFPEDDAGRERTGDRAEVGDTIRRETDTADEAMRIFDGFDERPPHRTDRDAAPKRPMAEAIVAEETGPSHHDGLNADAGVTLAIRSCPNPPRHTGELPPEIRRRQ